MSHLNMILFGTSRIYSFISTFGCFFYALGADPGAIWIGGKGMDIAAIVGLVAAISGAILGWTGRSRQIRQDGSGEGALRQDVEYIKRGVDDIRVDVRMQGQRLETVSERVTRVEESTKQAHKRLDRLEE